MYLRVGCTACVAQSALGFTTQPWGLRWAVRQCWDSGTALGAAAALRGGQVVNMVPRTLEITGSKLHLTGTVTKRGLGVAHQSAEYKLYIEHRQQHTDSHRPSQISNLGVQAPLGARGASQPFLEPRL